jgi:hypothetical protein
MAGLVPPIHVFLDGCIVKQDVDARPEVGHDGGVGITLPAAIIVPAAIFIPGATTPPKIVITREGG